MAEGLGLVIGPREGNAIGNDAFRIPISLLIKSSRPTTPVVISRLAISLVLAPLAAVCSLEEIAMHRTRYRAGLTNYL